MKLWILPLTLGIVLLVGLHVLNTQIGAAVVLALLVVTGIAWRFVKLIAGGVLILIGLG